MNHIRTPNRFELVLDEPVIIGMRQVPRTVQASAFCAVHSGEAALQMGGKANDKVKAMEKPDDVQVSEKN